MRLPARPGPQQPSDYPQSFLPGSRSRLFWLGLAFLLALYLLIALAISEVTPFNKGPDEGVNLNYVTFIITHGRLPVTYAERTEVGDKANWPALYHLLLAGVSRSLEIDVTGPPYIKIFWDSFRYRALDLQSEESWYLLTEDQTRPYAGRILVIHLGRWLSILFSTLTLLIVYLALAEMWPGRPWLALTGTALLAFIPAFIFIGSVFNEDALVALLAALYFWMLVKIIKQPATWWPYWLMGLVLGLSVTAKYTTVVLPLEVILVLGIIVWQRHYSWRWVLQRLLLVGGCALVASSWWFGWNLWFLNEVKELGWAAGLMRPIFTGGTDVTLARMGNFFSGGQIGLADLPENIQIGTFPEWIKGTFLSFWGVGIGGIIPLSPYVYLALGLLLGLAAWGLRRAWQQEPLSRPWLLLCSFHICLFLLAPLVRFWLSRRLGQTAQGRHLLIPAAVAIIALLVWGLSRVIPPRWQPWSFGVIIVGLVGWTGLHLQRLESFQPDPLPLRTQPEAAAWLAQPVEVQFGEEIKLVGYELEPHPEAGTLNLKLAWQTSKPVNENYLVQVSLLDQAGQVVSHWLGYNGGGRVPTLAWQPGDTVFDRLALPLPELAAGTYLARLQLLSRIGPLPVTNQPGQPDALNLAEISLDKPSHFTYPHSISLGEPGNSSPVAFALWPINQGRSAMGVFENPELSARYRYPATISVVTSQNDLRLHLVDPAGQAWPATYSQGKIHSFVIGPRWPSGLYRLKLTFPAGQGSLEQTTAEPVLTVENWWKRRFEAPEMEVSLAANFANQVSLLGYSLPQRQVKAGEALPVTLYWQAPAEMSPQADFIQFNQVLDKQGKLWGGYDRQPLEYYSTLLWAPGEVVVDGYTIPVEADAPPGEYYLNIGYYLIVGESSVNLPLVVDGQRTETSSVTLGPIEVLAP